MKSWWISCHRMTVFVGTENGGIVEAAPIVRRFIGQPLSNLTGWLGRRFGGLQIEEIGGRQV